MSELRTQGLDVLVLVRRFANILVRFEIGLVVLMIGLSFVWPSLLSATLITAAVFWILRWAAFGVLTLRTPADWGILLLLGTLPVTLWATALPEKTIPQVYRLLSGVALFYAIINWGSTTRRIRQLLLAAVLAGTGLALFAIVSVQWPVGKLPIVPGWLFQKFALLVSDTVHANVMAGCLVLLLPIPFAYLLFAWRERSWPERILDSEAVFVMLVIVALTQSRGAWIALAVVFLALVCLRWRRGWVILAPVTILALVAVSQLGTAPLLELLFSSSALSSLAGRIEVWSRAIFMIQDFPFTGIGMGSFMEMADALYPFFSASPGTIAHAHNLFLQIAVDLGIPGLVAWLSVVLVIFSLSWELYHHGRLQQDLPCTALGAGLLCSQLALVVHGLTDAVTWGMVRPAPIVWAIWGLAVASWYVYIQPRDNTPQRTN